jgi:hypothetical protein
MLQDCPSLIQPQASFTRKDSISEEMVQDGDKLDAEASSILIGFANQDAEDSKRKKYSIYFHHRIKDVILERPISCKGVFCRK